ncbi:DUF3298 domain-containing protein [Clostridium sp. chh4-2]|uniref:DUF3298 and DUF4163 domain-containing protein n=1 Tax=Clostridium sp. chh4-2 TaxID=2067550 RepID=UPI000CCF0C6F|nr:DUF3298 and DUF4163 domain-containing protein [Clostridium sp. chh4-2]PNV62705.1 DUF3298 domain-containing protein [Clostridium sp. chh4-2]
MSENKELAEMKKKYEEIPVPEQALERMKQGIESAKKESKILKITKYMKNTGVTAAAAVLAITVLTNVNPTIANAMEQIPVIGAIAKVVTFRTYEDHTNNFEAEIQVPKIETENGQAADGLNKTIEEYAQSLIKQYEDDLKSSEGQGNYSLTSNYEVVTDSEQYLSLRINTTLAIGSGTQYVKIFTIDKKTGEILTLDSLFKDVPDYKEKISQNIKKQMEDQMTADENIFYFYHSENPEDDFKGITGEESFYFNQTGDLVITFDEYEVAPGYMGAVEFTIPKDLLKL